MKTLVLSALALSVLVFQASAQVPAGLGSVKIDKIAPAVVKTPEIQFSGGSQKRSQSKDWLEVEVEFTTVPEILDELTVMYKILINGKLLTGDVTHVNIPKGKEHFSVAYVSPRALETAMGGKALTGAAIQGIWIEINKQGQILASDSTAKGKPVPNVPALPGMVLKKPETPFAPLYWDRYEAIKQAR